MTPSKKFRFPRPTTWNKKMKEFWRNISIEMEKVSDGWALVKINLEHFHAWEKERLMPIFVHVNWSPMIWNKHDIKIRKFVSLVITNRKIGGYTSWPMNNFIKLMLIDRCSFHALCDALFGNSTKSRICVSAMVFLRVKKRQKPDILMCSSRRTREESAYKSRNFFNLEEKCEGKWRWKSLWRMATQKWNECSRAEREVWKN